MTNIISWNDVYHLIRGMEALLTNSHENSPPSLWERIVLWAIAVAEAADMDGYLNGRVAHLERRIATLESSDATRHRQKRREIEL
jgi:hypothetical protein